MKKKAKPQYAIADEAHLVRMQVLIPRKDYDKLIWWRKKTGNPKVDLIRRAISNELAAEEIRLKRNK